MEIKGFPDYLIYEDGRVWSKKGKGKFLKDTPCPKGYRCIGLRLNKKRNTQISRRTFH